MCALLLRGTGLAGACVGSLRVDGGDRDRRDGNKEEGGQLGAHIQGASQHPALHQLAPLGLDDSLRLKQRQLSQYFEALLSQLKPLK